MNIFKKLKPFDYLIIVILLIGIIVGCLTITKKRQTSSNQIETTTNIEMEIYLRGVNVTSEEPMFNAGDETFITIAWFCILSGEFVIVPFRVYIPSHVKLSRSVYSEYR